ncbi:hypothetical protein BVC71_10010 [Marivivens niveibacter]|uniref:L,D-TPase catalytic domain-containing protein n=1 Tax=Marivivens niveibacter TaxID=1930667 RepID=A0A251WY39_9RHOB|nr:L,D-transpeptidase [Marivivens niveibacter]OUD09038.1 hypothetical protein BVC71_10010 [Marivivens niveibacter]
MRPLAFVSIRSVFALFGLLALVACQQEEPIETAPPEPVIVPGYDTIIDNGYALPAIDASYLAEPNRRVLVYYSGDEEPGTIEVDIYAKFLYWIMDDGTAWRYPIAVGRLGRAIRGDTVIRRKVEWPGWTPTANMLRTEPDVYGDFAGGIPGGLRSPLGARALYLYQGGRDTYYRIHGTNDLASIGNSGSAGCIRMFNHDIIHLFDMVPLGTDVVMRSEEDSIRIEDEFYDRGIELPATHIDPDDIYGEDAVLADRPIAEILADQLAPAEEQDAEEPQEDV